MYQFPIKNRGVHIDGQKAAEKHQGIQASDAIDSIHEINCIDTTYGKEIKQRDVIPRNDLKEIQIIKSHADGKKLDSESDFSRKGIEIIHHRNGSNPDYSNDHPGILKIKSHPPENYSCRKKDPPSSDSCYDMGASVIRDIDDFKLQGQSMINQSH